MLKALRKSTLKQGDSREERKRRQLRKKKKKKSKFSIPKAKEERRAKCDEVYRGKLKQIKFLLKKEFLI